MWRSTFIPETIFRRFIRLKQTETTCWTIPTHSYELNWAKRRTFHDLNSLSLVRLMKRLTFGQGLTLVKEVWVSELDNHKPFANLDLSSYLKVTQSLHINYTSDIYVYQAYCRSHIIYQPAATVTYTFCLLIELLIWFLFINVTVTVIFIVRQVISPCCKHNQSILDTIPCALCKNLLISSFRTKRIATWTKYLFSVDMSKITWFCLSDIEWLFFPVNTPFHFCP